MKMDKQHMGMMRTIPAADVDAVYQAIYEQLRQDQTLPTRRQLADVLGMELQHVARCLDVLRWQGRIERYTFLPTDYGQRWRDMPPIVDARTSDMGEQ